MNNTLPSKYYEFASDLSGGGKYLSLGDSTEMIGEVKRYWWISFVMVWKKDDTARRYRNKTSTIHPANFLFRYDDKEEFTGWNIFLLNYKEISKEEYEMF